jgi:hypothetical protein
MALRRAHGGRVFRCLPGTGKRSTSWETGEVWARTGWYFLSGMMTVADSVHGEVVVKLTFCPLLLLPHFLLAVRCTDPSR